MADLSSILALGNQQALDRANAVVTPPEHSDLRAGAMNYRASLNNAMALGAENLGWADTSQRLRDEAALGTAQAQEVMTPQQRTTDATGPIDAWKKGETGRYLSDIVHNIPSTLAQTVPAMAAPLTAGAVGGLTMGPAGALALGSAAMLPQTSGDIAGRQYANPDNKDSAGVRGMKALGLGAVSAVAQNVVPQWMGGKFVGGMAARGVETVANKAAATIAATPARATLAGSIARNMTEAVGGNAVAGAGAEALNQYGAGEALDVNRIAGAGVEGGIVGAPFGALGIAGEMAGRGKNPAEAAAIARSRAERGLNPDGTPAAGGVPPTGGAPGGVPLPDQFERPPSMRTTPAERKAAAEAAKSPPAAPEAPAEPQGTGAPVQEAMERATAGKSVADKLAAGEPLVDNLGEFATAVGDRAGEMFNKGKKTASDWVRKTAAEYVKRRDLTAEQRASAERAAANPDDPATHQDFGKTVNDLNQKDADTKVLDQLDKDFPEKKGPEGSKQSASTAGLDNRIAALTAPYMEGKHPEVVARANGVLRRLVASAGDEHGTMNEPAARRLTQLLGPQAHEMVQRVYDAVAPKDAVADARMQRHINQMQKVGDRERGLGKVIDESLPEDHNINVTHLKEALTRWARGDDDVGVDARGAMHHDSMRKQIESMFGDKADKVFDALEEYVKREDDKPGSTQNVKHDKDALDRGDQGSRRGDIAQEVGADYGELDEGAMDPVYYGGGSNPLGMKELIEDPNVYRAKFSGTDEPRESPAEKLIKKLIGKDDLPEDAGGSGHRNVRWISEQDYNRRHGIYETDASGKPTNQPKGSTTKGYIVHEESNDPTKFNDNDYASTRLDGKKYPRSPAKITVDSHVKAERDSTGEVTKPEQKAFLIDAVKLTERFLRNQESSTGDTNVIRNGKAFMDGILALQRKLEEDGDKRDFVDEQGLEKMVADGEIPVDAKLEDYGLVLLPDSLKIDKLGNTYGGLKKAIKQVSAKSAKDAQDAIKLSPYEESQLRELRVGFKEATKGEQQLRRQEAEEIYAQAKQRGKDFELAGDKENDLTRRKAFMGNKDVAGIEGVRKNKSTFATDEGDVIKGRDEKGNPIYDLSARTQADAWFDDEGTAKAQKAIDQLGDVHGGIDTGKVQQRDRDAYVARLKAKAKAEGRDLTKQEQARIDRMEMRNEARTPSDARTGKSDAEFDSSGSGRREISLDENPQLAQAVAGKDKPLARGLNMDEQPHSIDFTKAFKNEEERRELMNAVAKLNQTGAPGAKIGRRLAALVDAADSMREKDVAQLKRVGAQVLSGNLSPAEAATKINELSRKYASAVVDRAATRGLKRDWVQGVAPPEPLVLAEGARKGDFAGPATQPVATRPVPPEAPLVKKGNKAYEGWNKGKPSAMLKEQLGTHSDTLLDPVARIQQALMNGDTPEVDMKTPKGRKAVKDFAANSKLYDVTYGKDGQPVFTPNATGKLAMSVSRMRENADSAVPQNIKDNVVKHINELLEGGGKPQDVRDAVRGFSEGLMTGVTPDTPVNEVKWRLGVVDYVEAMGDIALSRFDAYPKELHNELSGHLNGPTDLATHMESVAKHGDDFEKALAAAITKTAGDVEVSTKDLPVGIGEYLASSRLQPWGDILANFPAPQFHDYRAVAISCGAA